MRFIAAFVGIVLSVPLLIFFWIGTQTFFRTTERLLAAGVVLEAATLLGLSLALFFTSAVQRVQALLLLATFVTVAVIYLGYRLFK